MFIFANFLKALASIVDIALSLYMWVIVARAIVSWVTPDPYNRIVVFIRRSTDPVLQPIRRKLPVSGMGIDFFSFYPYFGHYFFTEVSGRHPISNGP